MAGPSGAPDELGARCHVPAGPPPERTPSPLELRSALEPIAAELGFSRIGVTGVEPLERARDHLLRWLAGGFQGDLGYLGPDRADPGQLLPGAKSVIVVALAHGPFAPEAPRDPERGAVAAYARGEDYHLVLKAKLAALGDALATRVGRPIWARPAVDSAPLLERELAARAGLGFIGKNTMLIAPGLGSGILLGELIVDVEITPGEAIPMGCGSCRACLDACPTGAFVEPHVLDARRCISYLTIEQPGTMPSELRAKVGLRVFGCDACQTVCPYNATAQPRAPAPELGGRIPELGLDLIELLAMGNARYRKLVKRTALRRVTRDALARNAAVALGNASRAQVKGELCRALRDHPSPVVRAHAAWALGRLGEPDVATALQQSASEDPDPAVRREALAALGTLDEPGSPAYR